MSDLVPEFGKEEVKAEEPVSLRTFFLLCLLWLPLAFFFWFAMRSPITYATREVAELIMSVWLPGLVESTSQNVFNWNVSTFIPLPPGVPADAGRPVMDITVNVLLYTYGLAVYWGLIFASPAEEFSLLHKIRDAFIGWLIMLPLHAMACALHVAKEVFVVLGASTGPGYAEQFGVNPTVIAYFWQFSSLVMPTLSGLIMWGIMQRNFLKALQGDQWLETNGAPEGHKVSPENES